MAVKARAEITLTSIRDVQSVTRYYLLQSSTSAVPTKPTTNPPGGSWVTTEPTYTSGSTNSLYFTDCTVFSDGSFVYSDVSLSSSYEAAKVAYNKAAGAEDVATAAQETANGKNTVYYQTSAPTGGTYKTNDIWFDTNDGNKMYMWNGAAWTAETFGSAAISDLSITNAKIANATIQSAKIANLDAGKITTGTMSASRIKGDTLTLGGANNVDGMMAVYDANGNLVGSFTREGLMAIAGTIGGWTIEQDSLSGEQDFGEEKWHVALSPAFGLRFRDIPDGADPDSGWIREVYYNSGLARFSHVSNGNNYTGVIEACNESDGIQVVPELVVSGVDFPDSDDPITKVTSQSVETDAVKGKGLYLHPLGTGDSFYLQQPTMIMAGQTTISNGTYLKQATMCTIPSAYWSGYRILPFVTRTYGNSGAAPADNGDFYYAYYNSADHNVCIKLANALPSGVNFTFDYFIYALPIT